MQLFYCMPYLMAARASELKHQTRYLLNTSCVPPRLCRNAVTLIILNILVKLGVMSLEAVVVGSSCTSTYDGNVDIRWQMHTKLSLKRWSNENAEPLNSCRGSKKYVVFE